MKTYIILATALSALFGLFPVYIAKTTDHGDELCEPAAYYSAERLCVLLWDRTVIFFGLYFAIAAVFFILIGAIWRIAGWSRRS